jgi:phosphoribosylformimino-5-aminoimidazole carboxamide ribotide isomerase
MEIFPAIDIINGNVVRLTEGDYNRMTVYGSSPLEMAETFVKKGAKNLHMVDLDGAKDGAPVNFDVIKSVAETGKLFTEVGGGIRDEKRIEDYLSLGVNRVILGTVAVRNFKFVEDSVKKYGDKIAVGVDARDGKVAVSGWLETTEIDSLDFCRKLRDAGVKTVIYTDISKDGTLSGTNLEIYEKLAEIKGLDVIASGGITFEDEIKKLASMNTYGAIVGKAVYAGKLDLERVLKIAEGDIV